MKKTYLLDGLCCANCAAKIENNLKKIDGVNSAVVNFLTTKAVLDVEEANFEETYKQIAKAVKRVEPDVVIEEL